MFYYIQAKFSTLTDMTNHPRIINICSTVDSLYRSPFTCDLCTLSPFTWFIRLFNTIYLLQDMTWPPKSQTQRHRQWPWPSRKNPPKERPRDLRSVRHLIKVSEPLFCFLSLLSFIFMYMYMYLQGSIHAVSSFRVLTDGRLTAVCPRSKWENPTTQF